MLLTTTSYSTTVHLLVVCSLLGHLTASSPHLRSHVNDRVAEKKLNAVRETFVNDGLNSGWISLPRSSFINRGRYQSERAGYLFPEINDDSPGLSRSRNKASIDNIMTHPSMKNKVSEDRYNHYKDVFKSPCLDSYGRKDGLHPGSQPRKYWKFSKNRKDKEEVQTEYLQNLFEKTKLKNKNNEYHVYKLSPSGCVNSEKRTDEFSSGQSLNVDSQPGKMSPQNYQLAPNLRPRAELTNSQISFQQPTELKQERNESLKKYKIGSASGLCEGYLGRNEIPASNASEHYRYPARPSKFQSDFVQIQRMNEDPLKLILQKHNFGMDRKEIQQTMLDPSNNFFVPSTTSRRSTRRDRLNFDETLSTVNATPPSKFYEPTSMFTTTPGWAPTEPILADGKKNASFLLNAQRSPFEHEVNNASKSAATQFPQVSEPARFPPKDKLSILYEFLATSSPLTTGLASEVTPQVSTNFVQPKFQPDSDTKQLQPANARRREINWSPVEQAFLRSKNEVKVQREVLSKSKIKDSEETYNSSNTSSSNPNEYGPCALAKFRFKGDHPLYQKGKTHFLRKITDDVPIANRKTSSMDGSSDREPFFDHLERNDNVFQKLLDKGDGDEKKDFPQPAYGDGTQENVGILDYMKRRRHKVNIGKKIHSEFLKSGDVQNEEVSEIVKKKPIKFIAEEDQLLDSQSAEVEHEKAKWFHGAMNEKDEQIKRPGWLRNRT